MSRIWIGVDVCKDFLDAHARPAGVNHRFDNRPAGIEQLVAWAQPFTPQRVVLESTGPYQKAAVGALLAAGLPAVVVNARQVRDFAKAMNCLAKTDVLDAAVIAHFGEVATTTVRPLESQEIRDLRDLYDRRGQLVHMTADEKNRRHAAAVAGTAAKVLKSLDKHIDYSSCCAPVPNAESRKSLALPTGLAVSADGKTLYLAALGSSKVGIFNTAALENDTFAPSTADQITVTGGGPTGLVLDEEGVSFSDRAAPAGAPKTPPGDTGPNPTERVAHVTLTTKASAAGKPNWMVRIIPDGPDLIRPIAEREPTLL